MTTTKRRPGRPATGTDPARGIRIPATRWDAAEKAAAAAGTDRSKVVNAMLAWYLREPGATLPQRPAAK